MAIIKKEINKKDLQYQRERDRQMVRGKFMFHEVPGGTLSFNYHKYKGDPVDSYTLVDGEVYTLPYGVAKHLNNNVSYPEHAYMLDDTGKPIMRVGQQIRRCSFQSLEFMVDDDDFSPSPLVTAETLDPFDSNALKGK